ncbi:Tyrosine aminotransferase [uncultured Sphingopyxis sp.]|uniref:Tyrosine aminotransferase n=1 Tax=uncultured Sphingopyxis sp. TaxID=310581 RepID=A0A1Y5PT71_9SPHN|nr:amino acid aminotransferase [uncultured Sphingopyxis sp.]SBV31835.1 Tyrosine aminotransferase [uncultured Sphingopyxis sp.]
MSELLAPTPLPLGNLIDQPADALLGLIALHRADPRPEKLDLGVGVFRDDMQATPVMRAVKAAEAHIASTQASKSYLGAEGDMLYAERLAEVVLGSAIDHERTAGVQTPGGTGALRLGAELLARAHPGATVWIGAPTWPNHAPIFGEAGLRTRSHRFYDIERSRIDFASMLDELDNARPGDVLLLHGCCHNPSGADFSTGEWQAIAALCEARGLIPFVDLAYQGLGDELAEDAAATRRIFEALPTAILAYSCDKNFGLYRDRVGALWIQSANAGVNALVRANMLTLARSLWSMPPDHGAAIVRTILEDEALRTDWETELAGMRARINGLRGALAAAHPRLAPIGDQRGMFAMLPIAPEAVAQLRDQHGIYMAGNGRINIAGLSARTVPVLVAALAPHF